MLARLWWKEYRVFGPVWLILGLAAGLLQWLFLTVNAADSRNGGLTSAALCWAMLYAFAAGAAAFAGERESKTLGFLDALPVARGTLWLGKASFALVSTFGLALLLAGMAALGTETRDPLERYSHDDMVRVFGTMLFEAVAWSLFWSSVSKNPLLAGVMGVVSFFGSMIVIERLAAPNHLVASNDMVAPDAVPARLLVALVALTISGLVIAWRPSKPRPTRTHLAYPRPVPAAIRSSSTGRSLSWQAMREGWTTWLLVALVGGMVSIGSSLADSPMDGGLDLVLSTLASLVAGVTVFGSENVSRGRRFLVHHGVKPGTVWWRKLLVWGLAIGGIFGLMALGFFHGWGPSGINNRPEAFRIERFELFSVGFVYAFAVGLICGMAIYRRITAALVGVIVLIALVPLQIALVASGMVPAWSVVLVPLILLGVTRAWAGDWLMEREGFRPWARLGLLLAVPFACLAVGFIAHRAYGVPDVGPQFVAASLQGPAPSPDRDAAEVYRRAAATIRPKPEIDSSEQGGRSPDIDSVIEDGWNPVLIKVVSYWKENREVIDLARKATTLPRGWFESIDPMTIASGQGAGLKNLGLIHELLALDARERLARGDRSGARDDILALFRMAGQLGASSPPLARLILSARVHHRAVGLAFDWLAMPGLTLEEMRRVLADLKGLPEPPDLAPTMMAEAAIIERWLDLPADELAEFLLADQNGRKPSATQLLWYARVVAAPWERQRARRVCRIQIARELPDARLEFYLRSLPSYDRSPNESLRSSSLSLAILPSFSHGFVILDRELVGRRALVQAVAVEVWKLEHDGQYPESLQVLVPGLLDRLPLDPYSGKPFGFTRSKGQPIRPPITADDDPLNRLRPTNPGRPLIYSVGLNRTDEGGQTFANFTPPQAGDYVYAIP